MLGGYGNDILWGGAGNDTLKGGDGNDVYMFGRGDGHDTIIEDDKLSVERRNIIRLGDGIGVDDIELLVKSTDAWNASFIVRIKDTGETLTVVNGAHHDLTNAANSASIQAIEFADGTVWEWKDILKQPIHVSEETRVIGDGYRQGVAFQEGSILVGTDAADRMYGREKNDELYGGAGNDYITAGGGNDILHGGAGNDHLEGGIGNDTYLFNRGDGHDVIYETETRADRRNVVRLGDGIGVDDIELLNNYIGTSTYMDLVIRIKSTQETLTVRSGLSNVRDNIANPNSIQAIEFADGTVWNWQDILRQPMGLLEGVKEGHAAYGDSILAGGSGNDNLYGYAGNDTLQGGAGNDLLYSQGGNDILWGGAGNDRLEGGAGDDTYLFNRGDGQDIIVESAGDDTLQFGSDIGSTDLWFSKSGSNLVIDVLGTQDKVTIQNWYSNASYKVETITAGDMALTYTQMDQLIQAMASFGVPAGADGLWTKEQKEGVNAVLATYWRPTGS